MNYGEVLSKAWKIIWRFKILWIFGILASCSGNLGNGSSSSGNNGIRYNVPGENLPPGIQNFITQMTNVIQNIPFWVWILLFIVLLLVIVIVVLLGTVGRIGVIKGTSLADDGAASLPFTELFTGSFHYFWRVFLMNILVGLAVFAFIIVFFLFFVVAGIATLGIALLCLIPLACLLIPASWLVSLVVEQSTIAIVVEDLGIMAGISRGWDVIKRNIGTIIVMALILLIGGGIVGFILSLPVAFILVPPIMSIIFIPGSLGTGLIISALIFLVYLPIWLVLAGILRAYIGASWTLTYRRLTGKMISAQMPEPPVSMEPSPTDG